MVCGSVSFPVPYRRLSKEPLGGEVSNVGTVGVGAEGKENHVMGFQVLLEFSKD